MFRLLILKQMKKKAKVGQTNQSNQFLLDPRGEKAWALYVNPKSETFSNAYQSAIKAGFSIGHARQITTQEWWLEKARRLSLGVKGEKVLEKTLDMETNLPVIGQYGPIMIPTGEFDKKGREKKKLLFGENDKLLKIQQDSAKFVTERLLKRHYSSRTELTGGDGKELPTPIYGAQSIKK